MNDKPVMPPRIAAGIVKAQRSIDNVEKDKKAIFGNYASAEAIIRDSRKALHDAGLALVHCETRIHREPNVTQTIVTKVGADKVRETVVQDYMYVAVDYLLVHEDGATFPVSHTVPAIMDPSRPQDKAEAAALTFNLSYLLRSLLQLPRVDKTDDPNARDDDAAGVAKVNAQSVRSTELRAVYSAEICIAKSQHDVQSIAQRMTESKNSGALNVDDVKALLVEFEAAKKRLAPKAA